MPPSMSKSPAEVPAAAPVTRSKTPLRAVPSCLVPLLVVGCGSPRSHRPVVAVSVPDGLTVQPRACSKSSKKTTAVPVVTVTVTVSSSSAAPSLTTRRNE
jgi:hypothetical protein